MKSPYFLLLVLAVTTNSFAQQRFRLTANSAGVSAEAYLSDGELVVIDQAGKNTVYLRDRQFDTQDAQWLGFFSRSLNQAIRWPVSSSGNLQIGDVAGGSVRYRTSQMVIESLDRTANRPVLPPPLSPPNWGRNLGLGTQELPSGTQPPLNPFPSSTAQVPTDPYQPDNGFVDSLQSITPSPIFDAVFQGQEARPQMLQLATFDPRGSQLYLTRDRGTSLTLSRSPIAESDWWVVPAQSGYVRVQHYQNGRISALSAGSTQSLTMSMISQDPRQLWRVSNSGNRGRFVLESAKYSGTCLGSNSGQILLQPISYAPTQLWVPLTAPVLPNYQPFWRTVNQEVHANASLPPAQLGLVNSHRTAITVLLADQRQTNNVQQIRIEPGQSTTVVIDRDPGATIVETYEIRSPSGVWDRQQFVTAIPPRVLYDLSVYEEFLQSIAIDRTGKSPNPIEDVNYMPKSVGWFQLPPGGALPQSGSLDAMAEAQKARNPGAVRRMDPKQFEKKPALTPAETILNEIQSVPRRGF